MIPPTHPRFPWPAPAPQLPRLPRRVRVRRPLAMRVRAVACLDLAGRLVLASRLAARRAA